MKTKLTIHKLQQEAKIFSEMESSHQESSVDRKEDKINRQIILMNYNKRLILDDNE